MKKNKITPRKKIRLSPGKNSRPSNPSTSASKAIVSKPVAPENVVELRPEPPRPLTLKEKRVLEFLEMFIRTKGIAPSYQEICDHFGFASYNSVQRYLKQLEGKGYVRLPGANQKRGISLLRSAAAVQESLEELQREAEASVVPLDRPFNPEAITLPLLGGVAAGAPIERYEHDEYIDVPASLVRQPDRTFALRVQGQSMIEDGILDGDVILVQRQSHASNGEIIVAVVDEEATVKRFFLHGQDPRDDEENSERERVVELRPANSSMASMWFAPGQVQIRGIVVGLIRQF